MGCVIDTAVGIDASSDPSVHMTVGIDTHIWSLHYAGLRDICLKRSHTPDKMILTKATPENYWDIQVNTHKRSMYMYVRILI
jgi:hypothetical protein